VFLFVCVYTPTNTYTQKRTHVILAKATYEVNTHIYVYTHERVCVGGGRRGVVCVYVYMCAGVCLCVRFCVCDFVCECVWNIHGYA